MKVVIHVVCLFQLNATYNFLIMTKSSSKSTSKSSSSTKTSNRPKPMTPRAGFTANRRRYGEGGRT